MGKFGFGACEVLKENKNDVMARARDLAASERQIEIP